MYSEKQAEQTTDADNNISLKSAILVVIFFYYNSMHCINLFLALHMHNYWTIVGKCLSFFRMAEQSLMVGGWLQHHVPLCHIICFPAI